MKNQRNIFLWLMLSLAVIGCTTNEKPTVKTDENGIAILSDAQIENIVKRSYQYVAMYNVNNKFAFGEGAMATQGYNKGLKNTQLFDHSVQSIARPNNDVLYQLAMVDLRKDAAIFTFPVINSDYISLMVTGYDHYVNVPLSTTKGDFKNETTVLFYTGRTENYKGEAIEGVDEIFEMTGDFVSVILRVMPHANEKEKYDDIVEKINGLKGISLSVFLGEEKLADAPVSFPEYGATDADIFGDNLLEVMQFIFNHTTFDQNNPLDKAVLEAYKPLGIEPGKSYDVAGAVKIDGRKFREISLKIKDEQLAIMRDQELVKVILPKLFQVKQNMTLETMLLPSVVGPIGLPLQEAMYPPVTTSDGTPMNAQNDYVIEMTKDELPPAKAFWSLTLYDTENGFFIPNDSKKYSVGQNAGMKLNEEGGIKIYISPEKPDDVEVENWLPTNREDLGIDILLRLYAPDLEKVPTWKAPVAVKVEK